MATATDLDSFLRSHADISDPGHPASDHLVARAEEYLGVRFPEEYREFLKRWGSLAIGPLEIYGITGPDFEASSVPNTVWFTALKRRQVGLPHDLVVLSDNNGDEYYCLDVSDALTARVVVWDVRSRKVMAVKSDSLFSFILEEASEIT